MSRERIERQRVQLELASCLLKRGISSNAGLAERDSYWIIRDLSVAGIALRVKRKKPAKYVALERIEQL